MRALCENLTQIARMAVISQGLLTRFPVDFWMYSTSRPTICTANQKFIQQSKLQKNQSNGV